MEIDLSQWSYGGHDNYGNTQYTQQHGLGSWVFTVNIKTGIGQVYKDGQPAGMGKIKGFATSSGAASATPAAAASAGNDSGKKSLVSRIFKKKNSRKPTVSFSPQDQLKTFEAGGTVSNSKVEKLAHQETVFSYGGQTNVTKNTFIDGRITYVKDGKVLGTSNVSSQGAISTPEAPVIPTQLSTPTKSTQIVHPSTKAIDHQAYSTAAPQFVSENGSAAQPHTDSSRQPTTATTPPGSGSTADPKLKWQTMIVDDKGHSFTTKPGNKNDFTFADNGDLLEKRPGGNWYVAKDNSPGNNTPNLASEHGKNMGFITDNGPGSSPQKQSVAPDIIDRYVASHPAPPDALDRAVANHTNDTTAVNTHTDVLDRAVTNLPASSTWHANAAWAAPTVEGKTAISQIAPSLNTDDVLEARSGEHGNYLLRMKDGTYKSIDLASGGVSGAGTWNSSQWSGSSYSDSSHGEGASVLGIGGQSTPTVATPTVSTPVLPGQSAQELVAGDFSTPPTSSVASTASAPAASELDPGIQAGINAHNNAVLEAFQAKSQDEGSVTPSPVRVTEFHPSSYETAQAKSQDQTSVAPTFTAPVAQLDPGIRAGITANNDADYNMRQKKSEDMLTLPATKPEDNVNNIGFDPPGNYSHYTHGRMVDF